MCHILVGYYFADISDSFINAMSEVFNHFRLVQCLKHCGKQGFNVTLDAFLKLL